MNHDSLYGHPMFYKLLEEMAQLHSRKNHDYAGDDPLSNLRLCEGFGVPAWKGVLVRMSDKWARLVQLATKEPRVVEEKDVDTALDMAIYSLLYIILKQELKEKEASP